MVTGGGGVVVGGVVVDGTGACVVGGTVVPPARGYVIQIFPRHEGPSAEPVTANFRVMEWSGNASRKLVPLDRLTWTDTADPPNNPK